MRTRSEQVRLAVALADVERQARHFRRMGDGVQLSALRERGQRLEQHLRDAAPGLEPRQAALAAVTSDLAQAVLDARAAREDGERELAAAHLERALVLEQLAESLETEGVPGGWAASRGATPPSLPRGS